MTYRNWLNSQVKFGSNFLRMRMRSECWRHKIRNKYSQQFSSAQLICEYRCKRIVVTAKSRQVCYAFALAGSMNEAEQFPLPQKIIKKKKTSEAALGKTSFQTSLLWEETQMVV